MKRKKLEIIIPIIIIVVLILKSTHDLYGLQNILYPIRNNLYNKKEIETKDKKINIEKINYEKVEEDKLYTFKIKNSNNYKIKYNIYLKKYDELIELDNYEDKLISLKKVNYIINEKKDNLYNAKNNNYIIYTGTLNKNEEKSFNIKVYFKDNSQDKYMHLKIIYDTIKENTYLKDYLVEKKNNNNNIYYPDTDQSYEMFKYKNEYLYIGQNPNNYIYFNCKNKNLDSCELWRIMGIKKVLLSDLKNHYRIKLVRENISNTKEKYERKDYNINTSNIEKIVNKENNKYYETYYSYINEKDYKDSYRKGYDKICEKNLTKCSTKSYLFKSEEWLNRDDENYKYIIEEGNMIITPNNGYNYTRPTIYLKNDVKLLGGNGSKDMPYFIESKVD